MIDLNLCNEWQHRDPSNGLPFPWYVKSFLDELANLDLSEKIVFEYGTGASSIWWVNKCKKLYGVESNEEYFNEVAKHIGDMACIELESDPIKYVQSIGHWNTRYDIIVIDGIERDACIPSAVSYLKKDGVIIVDNWLQPSCWVATEENQILIKRFSHKVYHQTGHSDWKTLVFSV